MKNYAFINGETVLNIVVADTQPESTEIGYFIEYNEDTNFAKIGDTYSSEKNKFISQQPYPSWTLNEETCIWEAPSAKPENGYYRWDEKTVSWIEMIN